MGVVLIKTVHQLLGERSELLTGVLNRDFASEAKLTNRREIFFKNY